MWTGAKGFYKVEPVVADGGQVILYAPHITQISVMHPVIQEIGYHCRDYFLKQWDRFSGYHWGDLAHSTHLYGAGTWDAENGEHGRVPSPWPPGIPEEVTRAANLDYLDPRLVDIDAMTADPDTLVCRRPARCSTGSAEPAGPPRHHCVSWSPPNRHGDGAALNGRGQASTEGSPDGWAWRPRSAVEARRMSRVGSTTGSPACAAAPCMTASRRCMPAAPITASGAATVVNGGVTNSAGKMLSKPMTLTSCGDPRRPARSIRGSDRSPSGRCRR